METFLIIIGMTIALTVAFVLGAYVRKPFALTNKVIELPKAEQEKQAELDKKMKQFENMLSYNGKAQKDEN